MRRDDAPRGDAPLSTILQSRLERFGEQRFRGGDARQCIGRNPMTAERLRRFAAECEALAAGTRNPSDKEVWKGLAERWLRCAALMEQEETDLRTRRRKGRATIH